MKPLCQKDARRMKSAKSVDETHFLSFVAITSTRDGTEGSDQRNQNDPETSSIFFDNPLVSFWHNKNIRDTLVHSSLQQNCSKHNSTFPCGIGQCKTCSFTDSGTVILAPQTHSFLSGTISRASLLTSSSAINVVFYISAKLEDL